MTAESENDARVGDGVADSPARATPPPGDAPWGIVGVLFGLLCVTALVLTTTLLIAMMGIGVDLPLDGLPMRYAGGAALQIPLLIGAIVAAFAAGGGLRSLGFVAPRLGDLAISVLVGLGLSVAVIGYTLLLKFGFPSLYEMMARQGEAQRALIEGPKLAIIAFAVVLAPVAEELFFRGFVFGGLRRDIWTPIAALASALAFAAAHVGMWVAAPLLVLVGLAAAALYGWRRCIWLPIVMHASFNLTELLLSWLLIES